MDGLSHGWGRHNVSCASAFVCLCFRYRLFLLTTSLCSVAVLSSHSVSLLSSSSYHLTPPLCSRRRHITSLRLSASIIVLPSHFVPLLPSLSIPPNSILLYAPSPLFHSGLPLINFRLRPSVPQSPGVFRNRPSNLLPQTDFVRTVILLS